MLCGLQTKIMYIYRQPVTLWIVINESMGDLGPLFVVASRYLLGLSGAVVLHHYFWFIEGIACGGTKYVTQWHLVSLSSRRTYTKFSDQLHCPLVNFRNN